jgi:very-short-patch-repair endonuclease
VVSRVQLRELGMSTDSIDRRLAASRLIVVHRGVCAVGHAALSPRGRSVAALLAIGPDAVISHRSAAAMWRLLEPAPGVDVSVPRKLRSRQGVTVHCHPPHQPEDLRIRDGIPVTAPLRTLADLAATANADDLERAIAEAQVLRLVTPGELATAAPRLARLAGDARAAPTRSQLERAMLRIVEEARLPRPLVNARVGRYEVDFLWPAERLVAETDGWAAHGHRAAFERDRSRDAELQALGYAVLRFTWRQVADRPLLVAARLAQLVTARPAARG